MVSEVITVTTVAQLVCAGGTQEDPRSVVLKVPAAGSTIYFGGSGVTVTAGFPLAAGEWYTADLVTPNDLWLVIGSGTQQVNLSRSE